MSTVEVEERERRLAAQLGAAVAAELEKIASASRQLSPLAWQTIEPTATELRRVAIVAADAGNVRLRLAPLRIGFVRIASSAREEPIAELIFPSELSATELAAVIRRNVPELLSALDEAGVSTATLFAAADARRDRLAAVREVLEWGAILQTMQIKHDPPFLVVRDGLLRSIAFDGESFVHLRRALDEAARATKNKLIAVAKQVPGGADLINALMLGGVLDRRPRGFSYLSIPRELELELLPGSFVHGRRMGPLLLVRLPERLGFVPVEAQTEHPPAIAIALLTLFGKDAEYWPQPGMPVEVRIAHERARISALDREWLRAAFLDELRRRDPRLADRALAAEIIGAGGALITEEPER